MWKTVPFPAFPALGSTLKKFHKICMKSSYTYFINYKLIDFFKEIES